MSKIHSLNRSLSINPVTPSWAAACLKDVSFDLEVGIYLRLLLIIVSFICSLASFCFQFYIDEISL